MIRNSKKWQEFERNFIRHQKVDIKQNFMIFEAMYQEAVALKILPAKNPLEGLALKIKIAKAVNSVPATSQKNRQRISKK